MTMDELHDQLFQLLCEIDDICKRNGVRYFLDSGTEIGAAREKDFVPWDNDVDIKVLREDYPAFRAALQRELPDTIRFVEPDQFSPMFYDFISRVQFKDLPMRAETEEDRSYQNFQNRVGVDVFVFDRAPAGKMAQTLLRLRCKILYGMGMSKRYRIADAKYTFGQKAAVAVLRLMGKPFSAQWICHRWERVVGAWQKQETGWRFASNYSVEHLHVFPESWYADTAFLTIRGRKFPVPAGYDEELTAIYGDYMKPPADKSQYRTHVQIENSETENK